jgi:small-conductance mechanosensitive channel
MRLTPFTSSLSRVVLSNLGHICICVVLTATTPCPKSQADETGTVPPPSATIPQNATADKTLPSLDDLNGYREAFATNDSLDDATRQTLDQHLSRAIEHLTAANQATKLTADLSAELESTPRVMQLGKEALEKAVPMPIPLDAVPGLRAKDQLETRLAETTAALSSAEKRFSDSKNEIERRAQRSAQIADLETENKRQLTETAAQLAGPDPEGEKPEIRTARLIRMRARQHRFQQEAALYAQELRTYEGAERKWKLQRDLAERETAELEKLNTALKARIAEVDQVLAIQESSAAQQAALQADPAIRSEADRNAQLAQRKLELLAAAKKTQASLSEQKSNLKRRIADFDELKKRAETSDYSQAIGVLLRNQQAGLQNSDVIRSQYRERRPAITDLNVEIMDWDEKRRQLFIDLEGEVELLVKQLEASFSQALDTDLTEQVRELLSARLTLYQDLIDVGNAELDRMVAVDTQAKLLANQIDDEEKWLAEHVLWVRSAEWVGSSSIDYVAAFQSAVGQQEWRTTADLIRKYVSRHWAWIVGTLVSLALILSARQRLKARIREYGHQAQKTTTIEFRPTVIALILTLIVAWPVPLLVWFAGRRLDDAAAGHLFSHSIASALQLAGLVWGVIESIRQVARVGGVGVSHFEWPARVTRSVRRFANLLTLTLLPSALAAQFFATLGDEQITNSIGRVAFICMMVSLSYALHELLNVKGPIRESVAASAPRSLLRKTSWLWPRAVVIAPLSLAVLSAVGFHYTAVQLTGRLAATLLAVLVLVISSELVSRWLLITYRRLAIYRSREKRLKAQQQPADAGATDPPAPQAATLELKLTDINAQAHQIIRIAMSAMTLGALYVIWDDVLPAFRFLDHIEIWPNALIATDGDSPAVWITATDLLLAALIVVATLLASRNLPGMMEITVLKRLPLDAGARYAATSIARYVILITGFVFGFRQIGIGWESVQWLVAAMTVGLGFGLQEIFANFVSGIILLFERPIRVGDTVTIGEHSGTITRIRIRATTIMDWDKKDVIIPNREFVTGQVVNWTLTDPAMRLIIPVGVAYGSDTKLTEQLLYQVAHENSNVLKDPGVSVIFAEFGDNTLNFQLRTYVNTLTVLLATKHQLHLAIDELFKRHNIEIAFPQRDLHIRSIPDELSKLMQRQ